MFNTNIQVQANIRSAPTPPPAATPVPVAPTVESIANPYAAGANAAANEGGFEGAPRERVGRTFRFNQKGKYVHIADQMRQEAQLEALKQRIAESARKAGLDSEFETLERNIKVCRPSISKTSPFYIYSQRTYSVEHRLNPSGGMLLSFQTRTTMTWRSGWRI